MKSLPRLSVENPVLVHILMLSILAGGAYSGLTMVREMFPESRPNTIAVSAVYPGATPLEVEKGVAIKIEEAIKTLEHIDKIESTIGEGTVRVVATLTSDADDLDQAVNEFRAAVDAIPRDELPEEVEEFRVVKFEPKLPVIIVSIFGDADEQALKDAGRRVRDDLLLLPNISSVELSGTRKAELSVEVEPEKMVEYGISLAQVAQAIRLSNIDLPGGQLKTPTQNVAVRTLGETDESRKIAQTIVRTTAGGELVRVSDLGRVVDGFEDSEKAGRFNGEPAASLIVYKTGYQDAIEISEMVRAYVAAKRGEPMEIGFATRLKNAVGLRTAAQKVYEAAKSEPFPADLQILTHNNLARFIEGRLELLTRNGAYGLALVFISLLLFLNWRVAFWVMMGLVLSLCGALILMGWIGATLNLLSMFGLIIVLGLIVDDAIVIGENIYYRVECGDAPRVAAVRGAEEVAWPVIIAVFTTIGAFAPLMFIEGQMGDFMGVLPVVVTCALAVSLIEALSILPAHLAEWMKPVRSDLDSAPSRNPLARLWRPIREKQQYFVREVMGRYYERLLRLAVDYRYVSVALATSMLIFALGMWSSGRVPFTFIQKMDSETLTADLRMPVGTPVKVTAEAVEALERAALAIPEIETVYSLVGSRLSIGGAGSTSTNSSHVAISIIELSTVDKRDRSSEEVLAELRAETSRIPGVKSLTYATMQGGPGGAAIDLEITGNHLDDILEAVDEFKSILAGKKGVFDIADDFEQGRREIQIELLESARPLGLTTRALATEVRGAFYGLKARTLQRGTEDVDIRVRFPASRRRSVYELESMRIATPDGHMVPFSEVARLSESRGYASIRRVDQRRAVVVTADVDEALANAELIIASLRPKIAELQNRFAGLRIEFGGAKRETMKSFGSLKRDFPIAIGIVFVMLVGLFKSYSQPLVVLAVVPFGLIGAIGGHWIMDYPLTILSLIGIVALTGIVVNDSLILVDCINKEMRSGRRVHDAVIAAGKRRLRPIILTSLTTVLGLAPLMMEQSFQARFLIPMAISISFGLAFATLLTLVVVPSIFMISVDLKRIFGYRIDAAETATSQIETTPGV